MSSPPVYNMDYMPIRIRHNNSRNWLHIVKRQFRLVGGGGLEWCLVQPQARTNGVLALGTLSRPQHLEFAGGFLAALTLWDVVVLLLALIWGRAVLLLVTGE